MVMKSISLLLLILSSSISLAELIDDRVYINSDRGAYFKNQEINTALPTYLNFNEIDQRSYELEFSAEIEAITDKYIIFNDPRMNNRVISPSVSFCAQYKENFFGYNVCQRLAQYDVSDTLCEKLGLSGSLKGTHTQRVNSTSEAITYKYREDRDHWSILRIGSLLAPSVNYSRISRLKCAL